MVHDGGEISQLLERIGAGDRSAETRLFELLYGDLRRIATRRLRMERSDHTLQPTALVHETYVRIFRDAQPSLRDRVHFMALAARVMRQVLVDHGRAKGSQKRGGGKERVDIDHAILTYNDRCPTDFLEVHDALERLREWAPRQSHIVEMRFYGGMSDMEIAEYLKISDRTVKRDWAIARAWLHAELSQ